MVGNDFVSREVTILGEMPGFVSRERLLVSNGVKK